MLKTICTIVMTSLKKNQTKNKNRNKKTKPKPQINQSKPPYHIV